jgi:quinol monooxygenase YgiN
MVTKGLVVELDAKPGKEDELQRFLIDALPLVQQEDQTVAWFAFRSDTSSFGIVDVFPDEAGRSAHLAGEVAAALTARATELLARPPAIEPVEILAAKLPGAGGDDEAQ